ncbi:MAG TPA: histidine triad nucleotide-binding protein [Gammaproteobacteria bacterium]|nr:histidine triad nucleotide-binding protein [Gammaproteobacteria bacterium]
MIDCIFCKIIQKQKPADFIFEDEHITVFKDIHPKAPIHLLIIPKTHIKSLAEVSEKEAHLIAHMLLVMPSLAIRQGLKGFRTIINTGKDGGQVIDHLHFHLLGGDHLSSM